MTGGTAGEFRKIRQGEKLTRPRGLGHAGFFGNRNPATNRSGECIAPEASVREISAGMKSIWWSLVAACVFPLALGVAAASPKKSKGDKGKVELRHVVAFRFKETAKPEDVRRVEDAFAGLKNKIPQIQRYEWGLNNSPEGLNKGLTHGFILTFASEKGRDEYLVHPDHKAFGELLRPFLADVFVIDFVVRH